MKDVSHLTQYPLSCLNCNLFTSIAAAEILNNPTQQCRHCQKEIKVTEEIRRSVKRTLDSLQCCYNDSRKQESCSSPHDEEITQA